MNKPSKLLCLSDSISLKDNNTKYISYNESSKHNILQYKTRLIESDRFLFMFNINY